MLTGSSSTMRKCIILCLIKIVKGIYIKDCSLISIFLVKNIRLYANNEKTPTNQSYRV